MKKKIILLTLIVLVVFSGCTSKPDPEVPSVNHLSDSEADGGQTKDPAGEDKSDNNESKSTEQSKSEAFSSICSLYRQAVMEKWGGSKLIENNMSLMLLDCYGTSPLDNIGYAYADLDANGKEEFVIALTDAFTDSYYGKIVLDVYSVNDNGEIVQVLSSGDRNRYYYAGGNLFANVGSGAASVDINTTLKLQGVEMIDTTTVTDPADYQQIKLDHFR